MQIECKYVIKEIKMLKFILAIMMAVFMISCVRVDFPAQQHQTHNIIISKKIYVDAAFTEEEIKEIKNASNMWEKSTDGIIHYDLIFGFDMNDKNSNKDPYMY